MAAQPAAARLFPHHHPADLAGSEPAPFVFARLLEDGSSADLRTLFAATGEAVARAWLEARGGRALSRRSRAFWEVVLSTPASPPSPLAGELWPLA